MITATCGGPIRPPGRGVRIYCGSTGRAGRRDDRTGDRTRERGRTSVAARSGRTSVRPAVVVHRGGRAVPHRRGHREVLRADLPDLPHDVGMDARRRTAADRTLWGSVARFVVRPDSISLSCVFIVSGPPVSPGRPNRATESHTHPQRSSRKRRPAQADAPVRHHRADRHALRHCRPPGTHRQTAPLKTVPWR